MDGASLVDVEALYQMEVLRAAMADLYLRGDNLCDQELIALSARLDELVTREMRLRLWLKSLATSR